MPKWYHSATPEQLARKKEEFKYNVFNDCYVEIDIIMHKLKRSHAKYNVNLVWTNNKMMFEKQTKFLLYLES